VIELVIAIDIYHMKLDVYHLMCTIYNRKIRKGWYLGCKVVTDNCESLFLLFVLVYRFLSDLCR